MNLSVTAGTHRFAHLSGQRRGTAHPSRRRFRVHAPDTDLVAHAGHRTDAEAGALPVPAARLRHARSRVSKSRISTPMNSRARPNARDANSILVLPNSGTLAALLTSASVAPIWDTRCPEPGLSTVGERGRTCRHPDGRNRCCAAGSLATIRSVAVAARRSVVHSSRADPVGHDGGSSQTSRQKTKSFSDSK